MQEILTEFLRRRKDRSIAIILGVKERECDKDLSAAASQKLRKVVLDQMNEFYEAVLDIMDSLDSGEVVLNEIYLSKIDDLHQKIVMNGHEHG